MPNKMTYTVTYDLWFRCGRTGDDKDFDSCSIDFETLDKATAYVDELVEGKYRGLYDCAVHRNEVAITENSSK